MGLPNIFKFQKLKISPLGKKNSPEEFEVMFNPNTLSVKYENRFAPDQTNSKPGDSDAENSTPKRDPKFLGRDISTLDIKILIDGTGVSETGLLTGLGFSTESVAEKVKNFLKLTMIPGEATHEPSKLELNWGEVIKEFPCNLKSVNINYTLFNRDGSPLRAELDCIFISSKDENAEKAGDIITLSSPDLTHRKIVKEGDSLPALCTEIYGNSAYYLQIAEVNELDNFRALDVGMELFFPPINKTT